MTRYNADSDLSSDCISELQMFDILNSLCPTAAGLDYLQAWYLRIAELIFCKHVAFLFNLSLATPTVCMAVEGSLH